MKKLSMFFSVLAMTLAVAGAFAFDKGDLVETRAWIDTSGANPICTQAPVPACNGTNQTCKRSVGGVEKTIYEFDNTADCLFELKMP